jgi:tetratricopeptide (TPR) repeat protein
MPINSEWRFCKHCNKPLIVNLKTSRYSQDKSDNNQTSQEGHYYAQEPSDISNQGQEFSLKFDPEANEQLKRIDRQIEQKLKDYDSVGSLLLEKAGIYYNNRDFTNSLKILKEALEDFEEESDESNIAITHNQIGLISEEKGFYDEAIYHFDNAVKILKKIGDVSKLVKVYNNIANAYYLVQDIEQSYSFYKKALTLAKRENLMDDVIKTNSNIAEILMLLNQFHDARKRLSQNLRYFQSTNDVYGIINTYNKLGKLEFLNNTQNYQKSISYLEKAINLIEQIQGKISPYMKAELEWESYFYLGKSFYKLHKMKKAKNYLFLSLDAVRTYHPEETINEALILDSLARLYEYKQNYDKSIEYYSLANKIFSKFGQDEKIAEGNYKMAQIYRQLSQKEKALRNFEKSLQLFERLEYVKEIAEIHHEIGKIYLSDNLIDLAISSFREAQKYYEEIQDSYHLNLLQEKINSLQ